MHCIGDECAVPQESEARARSYAPLMRSVAVGALCAGLGYLAAQSRPLANDAQHLAAIAPPLVMVSELGE
jgi:hypothetical protein